MAIAEFALIERYFKQGQKPGAHAAVLGIGDDAAIVDIPIGQQLCVAVDTLVAGVHFPEHTPAYDIAYKALAVNLSDMAAMGATPRWFTLALTLPTADERWIKNFSEGLFALAQTCSVELIGGDTTCGPLCISIQIMGLLPRGQALLRSGAQVGDDIYVSGTIGDAGLGLRLEQLTVAPAPSATLDFLLTRLNRPTPRLQLGQALLTLAHAAIDVSDGLLVDLQHVLTSSQRGARVNLDAIPLSDAYRALSPAQDKHSQVINALEAGDDYELCFTAPPQNRTALAALSERLSLPLTRIGEVTQQAVLHCVDQEGKILAYQPRGFEHFTNSGACT